MAEELHALRLRKELVPPIALFLPVQGRPPHLHRSHWLVVQPQREKERAPGTAAFSRLWPEVARVPSSHIPLTATRCRVHSYHKESWEWPLAGRPSAQLSFRRCSYQEDDGDNASTHTQAPIHPGWRWLAGLTAGDSSALSVRQDPGVSHLSKCKALTTCPSQLCGSFHILGTSRKVPSVYQPTTRTPGEASGPSCSLALCTGPAPGTLQKMGDRSPSCR